MWHLAHLVEVWPSTSRANAGPPAFAHCGLMSTHRGMLGGIEGIPWQTF
jgi:hypothetical protein